MKTALISKGAYDFQAWEVNGVVRRIYIKKANGRRMDTLGYIEVEDATIVPSHGQHIGSVKVHISKAGETVEHLIEQLV